jgi:imidazolonepropionase-like amidohydrolase
MTAQEALKAATASAADKLGLSPDLGTVAPGKLADLVVLDADPLADIHNTTLIRWVVKNGTVYEAETLKEIWPRERELPAFFWQSERGPS